MDIEYLADLTNMGETVSQHERDVFDYAQSLDWDIEFRPSQVRATAETNEAHVVWTGDEYSGHLCIEATIDGDYLVIEMESEPPTNAVRDATDRLDALQREAEKEHRQAQQEYRNSVL